MELDTTFVRWRLFYRAVDYFLDRYGMENGLGKTVAQMLDGNEDASYEHLYSKLDQQHRDYLRCIYELMNLADCLGYAPGQLGLDPAQRITEYAAKLRDEAQQLRSIYQDKGEGWLVEYAAHVMASDELLETVCSESHQALGIDTL